MDKSSRKLLYANVCDPLKYIDSDSDRESNTSYIKTYNNNKKKHIRIK